MSVMTCGKSWVSTDADNHFDAREMGVHNSIARRLSEVALEVRTASWRQIWGMCQVPQSLQKNCPLSSQPALGKPPFDIELHQPSHCQSQAVHLKFEVNEKSFWVPTFRSVGSPQPCRSSRESRALLHKHGPEEVVALPLYESLTPFLSQASGLLRARL